MKKVQLIVFCIISCLLLAGCNNVKFPFCLSDKYYQDGVYFVSSSLINDVMMFNSLGIKIPMKINVLNDVRVNFKTRVESYGINSILVELYLVMDVKSWFVNPFNDVTFGETYEYVLSSKIINGSVPMYYGENIEKSSSIVSS